MSDIFRTLIIPSSQVELARQIAASFGPGGVGMWTTELSAGGTEPATHFISTGYIPEQFAFMVPCQTWTQDEEGVWTQTSSEPGNPEAVYEAATAQGVDCTLAGIQAVFAAADVTEQEPFVAMSRLGLQIVQRSIL